MASLHLGFLVLNVLAERPRRRTLQQLPPEAIAVLYHNDEPQQDSQPIAA